MKKKKRGGKDRGRDIFKDVISSLRLMLIREADVSHERERERERDEWKR